MVRGRRFWWWWVPGVVLVVVVLSGILFFRWQAPDSAPGAEQGTAAVERLGLIYLPLSPKIAAYYGLGVESGALVTEVVSGSLLDKAGIKKGDVILSFNGVGVGEGSPLLGMMRACPVGSLIRLEVQRGEDRQIVEIVHSGR